MNADNWDWSKYITVDLEKDISEFIAGKECCICGNVFEVAYNDSSIICPLCKKKLKKVIETIEWE